MAWPPSLPTGTRTNATPQANQHPDDHNKIAAALAAMVVHPRHSSIKSSNIVCPANVQTQVSSWGFVVTGGWMEVFCVLSCVQGATAGVFDVTLEADSVQVAIGKGLGTCTVSLRAGLPAPAAGGVLVTAKVNAWGGQPVTVEQSIIGAMSFSAGSST